MTQLSKNFTLEELIHTNHKGIDNTPSEKEIAKLERLANEILQPVREAWGKPLVVNSAFRCARLNAAVGGSKTSQHLLAEAADIRTTSGSAIDNKKLFDCIQNLIHLGKLQVGQLIDEYGYKWVHISLPRTNGKPNNQILHLK